MKPQAIACSFVTTPVPRIRLWKIRFFVRRVSTSRMCSVMLFSSVPHHSTKFGGTSIERPPIRA